MPQIRAPYRSRWARAAAAVAMAACMGAEMVAQFAAAVTVVVAGPWKGVAEVAAFVVAMGVADVVACQVMRLPVGRVRLRDWLDARAGDLADRAGLAEIWDESERDELDGVAFEVEDGGEAR